jgi:hypothetical protein
MFLDGDTKNTSPVPANAGTNVVVVVGAVVDGGAVDTLDAGALDELALDAESDPPQAMSAHRATQAQTSPGHRTIT